MTALACLSVIWGCEAVIVFPSWPCALDVWVYCCLVGACEFGEEGDHAVVVGSGPCGSSGFRPTMAEVLACEARGSGPSGSSPDLCGLRF